MMMLKGITIGICDFKKKLMVSTPAISVALAVMADAGPIPKAVVAVMTETADKRLTPKLTRIGNIEAINNKPKPAADGMATNKS